MEKKGFTLIEILIACAIFSISIMISLNLINTSNKALLLSKNRFTLNQKLINQKHRLLSLPYSSKELKGGIHSLKIQDIFLTWEVKNKGLTKHIHITIKKKFITENISFIKIPK